MDAFLDNGAAVHDCAVPDILTSTTPDFATNECEVDGSGVEEEVVWMLRWFDPRTMDCFLEGDDGYAHCSDEDYDGVMMPGLLFDDRDNVFVEDTAAWEDVLCYDEDLTADCETDYWTLWGAFNSGMDADELTDIGLSALGVGMLLVEYEIAFFSTDFDDLSAAVCGDDILFADCEIDFTAFCDADVETMFESADGDFGRDEITELVAFIMEFTDDDGEFVDDGTADFLFAMCGGDFGETPATIFAAITETLADALLDDSLFEYAVSCDATLAAGVAGALVDGVAGLPGCSPCDLTEGVTG